MKSRLPVVSPFGVNTSITSSAFAGTLAVIGTLKTVFDALSGTLILAMPIWVSDAGNPVGNGWLLV
jgi:hypothetical protein